MVLAALEEVPLEAVELVVDGKIPSDHDHIETNQKTSIREISDAFLFDTDSGEKIRTNYV